MNEHDMEELLAKYPEEFFPRKVLKLKGRQESFAGVGRFDLLFEDNRQNNILMELKAVTAKLDVADQLGKYKDALEERGEKNIILWLVAPKIPKHVADCLDRLEIEHTEVHEAEFRQVAVRYGISMASETPALKDSSTRGQSPTTANGRVAKAESGPRSWSFQGGAQPAGGADEFLNRCDQEGKAFFSALLEKQRSFPNKTKITWNHESGFSMQFCFKRLGFVEMVWGFPTINREGKQRAQKLVFPFDFAQKRGVPDSFIDAFGSAIAERVPFTGGTKRPGLGVSELTPIEIQYVLQVIFEFAEKAGTVG
jgi:hypothetical protein